MPTGEVREFQGRNLDPIANTEGLMGFITQVTFKIQPWEELAVEAIGGPNAYDLHRSAHRKKVTNLVLNVHQIRAWQN